jgi:hypothetical protein
MARRRRAMTKDLERLSAMLERHAGTS